MVRSPVNRGHVPRLVVWFRHALGLLPIIFTAEHCNAIIAAFAESTVAKGDASLPAVLSSISHWFCLYGPPAWRFWVRSFALHQTYIIIYDLWVSRNIRTCDNMNHHQWLIHSGIPFFRCLICLRFLRICEKSAPTGCYRANVPTSTMI